MPQKRGHSFLWHFEDLSMFRRGISLRANPWERLIGNHQFSSPGEVQKQTFNPVAGEMVRQARVLAQATSDLVNAMRSDAEAEIDMENSKKLLAAAKLLADSTARMVEAAKVPQKAKRTKGSQLVLNLGGGE